MILKITYITIIAAILSTLVLFIVTHIPSGSMPQNLRYNDKFLHFIAYAIVSFLYGISFSPRGIKGIFGLIAVILFMCVFAAVDEYSQQYFDRTTDLEDYYADIKGIAAGTGISFMIWLIKTVWSAKIKINISR